MRSSTLRSTKMMITNIDTCSFQEPPTNRCLAIASSSKRSGATLEFSNLEDGSITRSTDLSHSSYYLEDHLAPTPRLAKLQITTH